MAWLPAHAQDIGETEEDADLLTVTTAPVQEDIQLDCRFVRACQEGEACQDAGFSPLLDARAGGLDPRVLLVEANLIADAGTTFVVGGWDNGRLSLSGGDFDARHLLTIAADGAARHSVHSTEGPMMVGYMGTCEGQND